MAILASKRVFDSQTGIPLLVSVQTFTVRTIYFFRNVYKDATWFEDFLQITLLQCSDKWRGSFCSTDVETSLALDASAQRIGVKKSAIPHPEPEVGLFSSCTNSKDEVVRYCHGSLVYAYLSKRWHKTKTDMEEVMLVTTDTFWK